jgi:hypothetical protein
MFAGAQTRLAQRSILLPKPPQSCGQEIMPRVLAAAPEQNFMKSRSSLTAIVLSAALVVNAAPVQAAMVATDSLLMQESNASQLTEVQAYMAREDVQEQMKALGVDPSVAATRVAAMTPGELSQVQQHIQDMPAGGSAVGLVLTVFLILILLELVGAINIFPRI